MKSPSVLRSDGVESELSRFFVGIVVGMLEVYAGTNLNADTTSYDLGSQSFTLDVGGRK